MLSDKARAQSRAYAVEWCEFKGVLIAVSLLRLIEAKGLDLHVTQQWMCVVAATQLRSSDLRLALNTGSLNLTQTFRSPCHHQPVSPSPCLISYEINRYTFPEIKEIIDICYDHNII